MRFALWLLALFAVAVAIALFAGDNPGTVTLFWPPHRIDLSVNLVLLLLLAVFVVLHLALRALSVLFALPAEARRWRLQQRERMLQGALLDAMANLLTGRYIRARKAAELVLTRADGVARSEDPLRDAGRLRVLSHLLAAESAQALQDRGARTQHLDRALELAAAGRETQELRDGLLMRSATWSLQDQDAGAALQSLDQLPQGVARRTLALRLRLRAARMARQTRLALETARLLIKHRAFPEAAAQGILRALALEWLRAARDAAQLQASWADLDEAEQALPDVAIEAAQRLLALEGDASLARRWLLPLWEPFLNASSGLTPAQRTHYVMALEQSFGTADAAPEPEWLTRIEQARLQQPGDALLQYLAGV
ncbi:MAG: heme biosynthesis protein HemY, partial [Rhodoferax sp.]|nr:heme biosynthesis protein HemY [Rhodoferax sp.]